MPRLSKREIEEIVDGRNPAVDPRAGDIVRSDYPSIGDRRVTGASESQVSYYRVRPNGREYLACCLPTIWQKWCRAHRVKIIQRAGVLS